jgi:hypothetical protein
MAKKIFVLLSILFLIYLVMPGPSTIDNFPALPNSAKSTLEGDTIQLPRIVGYFSNNYRAFATNFYRQSFQHLTWFPFLPWRLNYPPEFAFTAIKDQTHSTYLEEFYYPLRDSLFVNGLEPFEDGIGRYNGATKFMERGQLWDTKVTLRYYPSSLPVRLIVGLGVIASVALIWKLSKRIIFNV